MGRGIERPITCPSADHDDHHASASVNVLKGIWYCYACHAKGVAADYVPDPKIALKMLAEIGKTDRIYPEAWLDIFDADHPSEYWSMRYGAEIARSYRCGTNPTNGNPTYPLRNDSGRLLGVVERTDTEPKYRYPYGPRTSQTLFLSHHASRATPVVVLVEGASDVFALAQAGIPKNWRIAGTYGAGVHYPQVQIVASMAPKVIVAAFDADPAGTMASQRATDAFADVAPVLSHQWDTFGTAKDPGELETSTRISALTETLSHAGYIRYRGDR